MSSSSVRGSIRLSVVLLASCFVGGCVSIGDLQPAFQTNQTNVNELKENEAAERALLDTTAEAVWQREIAFRERAVIESFITNAIPSQNANGSITTNDFQGAISGNGGLSADYTQLSSALALAKDDAKREQLIAGNPVLAAYAAGDVSADDIVSDYNQINSQRKAGNFHLSQDVRDNITKKYPYYSDAVSAHQAWQKTFAAYKDTMDQKFDVATKQADLFNHAATASTDIWKVIFGAAQDPTLQANAVALVKNDKAKSALQDAFKLIGTLNPSANQSKSGS
ncbi:MAG TPA: hypothetical protein VM008_13475 [Phycisphaerae bacterium]|nr:hypothetical protein [Phycisphaerae bacterium]